MNGQVIYNSEELQEVVTNLNQALEKVSDGIKNPLGSKFNVLEEVGFFTEGMSNLEKEAQIIYNTYKSLVEKLNLHDEDMINAETTLSQYINNNKVKNPSKEEGSYTGGGAQHENITTDNIDKGESINNDTVEYVIEQLDSDVELQILNAWKNEDTSVANSMLLSTKNSGVLLMFLKNILGEENIQEIEVSDDTIKIQKALLESFINNNVLEDYDEDTIFAGLQYLKKVALENNIAVSDLLLDDKYNDLFLEAVKDLYNNKVDIDIPKEKLDNIKNYLDKVSDSLKVSVEDLISSSKYIEFIKQGELK